MTDSKPTGPRCLLEEIPLCNMQELAVISGVKESIIKALNAERILSLQLDDALQLLEVLQDKMMHGSWTEDSHAFILVLAAELLCLIRSSSEVPQGLAESLKALAPR